MVRRDANWGKLHTMVNFRVTVKPAQINFRSPTKFRVTDNYNGEHAVRLTSFTILSLSAVMFLTVTCVLLKSHKGWWR